MHNNKNNNSQSRTFKVENESGLLEFLLANCKGDSRSKIKANLKYKQVSVDGKPVTQFDYRLKKGQIVTVGKYKPEYKPNLSPDMPDIVYEDDSIIVIDKPAGLLAVATDDEKTSTAYRAVMEYVQRKNKNSRIFIVHRLDRDTSGLLLFAKNDEIKYYLQDNWDSIVSYRGYCALAEGIFEEKSGRIESWLRETDSHFVYSARNKGDGKHSITNYEVKREGRNYSLVAVNIETGRKNQIRVHLSEMGHPIAGDKKYGAETNPIRRLGLHADRLVIKLPYMDEELDLKLPVPKKFLHAMKND